MTVVRKHLFTLCLSVQVNGYYPSVVLRWGKSPVVTQPFLITASNNPRFVVVLHPPITIVGRYKTTQKYRSSQNRIQLAFLRNVK